jgi:transcriptional regulator with XRE-family HTH domain
MGDVMPTSLCARIARLAEELGWNQQSFARRAKLNRLTIARICGGQPHRLHNATVQACAAAFGIGPHELRTEPIERLLPKVRPPSTAAELRRRLFEQAMQPEVRMWMEQNPDRAAALDSAELDELLSLQGVGGPLTAFGVAEFVQCLERRRRLVQKVIAVAGTEYVDLLESFVEVLFEKVQPYRDRS